MSINGKKYYISKEPPRERTLDEEDKLALASAASSFSAALHMLAAVSPEGPDRQIAVWIAGAFAKWSSDPEKALAAFHLMSHAIPMLDSTFTTALDVVNRMYHPVFVDLNSKLKGPVGSGEVN
jgi:hypothetical protein